MSRTDSWQPAVVAFRVKSGWATAVLLTGPIDAPVVLDAGIVDLSDPKVPNSRQPYHDGIYVARKEGPQLERLLASVAAYSHRSLAALLSNYVAAGYRLSEAGLVVGSDCDPAVILNPHIPRSRCASASPIACPAKKGRRTAPPRCRRTLARRGESRHTCSVAPLGISSAPQIGSLTMHWSEPSRRIDATFVLGLYFPPRQSLSLGR